MRRKIVLRFFCAAVSVYLYGCASGPAYLVNLDYVKDTIIRYYESGNYSKETGEAVDDAIQKFAGIKPEEHTAVVFDVDDTALSDYPYEKETDFGYIPEQYDMWIERADAPAVPGVLRLYDYLIERKFKIIFLTGRKSIQYDATYRNLLNAGYTAFDTLIVRTGQYSGYTALSYKSEKRTELTNRGYVIAGTVGDQMSDLDGPYHGVQVKIPNYLYFIE
jgi:acid phosphatase